MKKKKNSFNVAFSVSIVIFCLCFVGFLVMSVNQKEDVMGEPQSIIFFLLLLTMFVCVVLSVVFLVLGIHREHHPIMEKEEAHHEISEHFLICPSCHEENPSTSNFCKNCGASLKDAERDDLIYEDKSDKPIPFGILLRANLFTMKSQAFVYVLLIVLLALLLTLGIVRQLTVLIVMTSVFMGIFLLNAPLLVWLQHHSLKKHLVMETVRFYPDGFDVSAELKRKDGNVTQKQFYSFSLCTAARKYKNYYFFYYASGPKKLPMILMIEKTKSMQANQLLDEKVAEYSKKGK